MKLTLVPRPGQKHLPAAVIARVLVRLLMLLLLFLTILCVWAVKNYSNISLEEVIFYLSMPLRGTSQQFTHALIKQVLLPFAALVFLLALSILLPLKKELRLCLKDGRFIRLLPLRLPLPLLAISAVIWACILYPAGDSLLGITTFLDGRIHQSKLIEKNYADPAKVSMLFPEKKRNLITLYIESEESTNQDPENGGLMDRNYIPELTQLAKDNVSFSQNDLITGAAVAPACGWTVAGLVAQTAGIPLKFYQYDTENVDNMGADLADFLPGATMLGDILEDQGYQNVFLCGSDFDFGGRRQMYAQHGAYDIYDYYAALDSGWIPEGYSYGWGFEDKRMYEMAKTLLTQLAEDGRPFHLGMLTVDTHDPGWLCELCPQTDTNIYGRVVQCSSKQAADFIDWCREQPWYADTVIVITGDHASMSKSFYVDNTSRYAKHKGDTKRLVYNVFINAESTDVPMKNRKFTTLDFFPSILAAMGVTIDGDRLGLGTNLFSGRPTLSEELGYNVFFSELNKKSNFYDLKLLR